MTDDFVTGFPTEVSHGLCPESIVLLYPTIAERILERLGEDRRPDSGTREHD